MSEVGNIKSIFKNKEMIDLTDAEHVQLYIDSKNKVWVNVDGVCLLRIGKVQAYSIETDKVRSIKEKTS